MSSPVDDMDTGKCPLATGSRSSDINSEGTGIAGSAHAPKGSAPDPNPSVPNTSTSSAAKTSDQAGVTNR